VSLNFHQKPTNFTIWLAITFREAGPSKYLFVTLFGAVVKTKTPVRSSFDYSSINTEGSTFDGSNSQSKLLSLDA
jgi:hypothetical protein